MEAAISAVAGELLGRFISFLAKKYYTDQACREKDLEKLQNLILQVHTVVEEAEGRYITNSSMLIQLKNLVEGMYRGYYVLDTFKYRPLEEMIKDEGQVRCSYSLSCSAPAKRLRATCSTTKRISVCDDLKSTLKNLETIVANMTEFVILLGACERMSQKPYDTYLYLDKFMFGHVVEKQWIINFLLQDSTSLGAPVVLPVISGRSTGKKTLVRYACSDSRVRAQFSSILHLKGDDIWRMHLGLLKSVRTLVIIEFDSDVDDEDWVKFCSSTTLMGRGSKVIIISRHETIARFGTVKPTRLKKLTNEEYIYLFKVLAFGSVNPEHHPRLALIGIEMAEMLQGSLISGNVIADVLRKNLNVQFWLRILIRCRNAIHDNLSMFGEHPKALLDKDHPVDLTKLVPLSATSLRLMPPRSKSTDDACMEQSKMTFGDLLAGSNVVLPQGEEFQIPMWESRIPPFTKYVATCVQKQQLCTDTRNKKRRVKQIME